MSHFDGITEPPEGFAPALGGALTLEHAWSYLLPHHYLLPCDASDPVRLMRWPIRSRATGGPNRAPRPRSGHAVTIFA